jgi:hypothetical protein
MIVKVSCPYSCEETLICHVDTNGDPSTGIQPQGLEEVTGSCIHASAINGDLEERGEDDVKMLWSRFNDVLEYELNKIWGE